VRWVRRPCILRTIVVPIMKVRQIHRYRGDLKKFCRHDFIQYFVIIKILGVFIKRLIVDCESISIKISLQSEERAKSGKRWHLA
jgi:hypothetical protein